MEEAGGKTMVIVEGRLTIDPVTRLEGHGKIDIFMDERGGVKNAYLQVPELRGFERFCVGRLIEDLPRITSNICGVCSPAHHLASVKAVDSLLGLEPTPTAAKLREMMHNGYMIADHILNFYFLSGPDFLVGVGEKPAERNILGVLKKYGEGVGRKVIEHRAYGQRIVEIVGGKAVHPVTGVPGGLSKPISEKERKEIEKMARSCVEFAEFTLQLYDEEVLKNADHRGLLVDEDFALTSYDAGLVDREGHVNLYDGDIKITAPDGSTYAKIRPEEYFDHVAEEIMEWTYVKFPYLRRVGWRGLTEAPENGVFRVGPLARLNVAKGMATSKAQREYERMVETFKRKPINNIFAYHWARLIELLYASERVLELSLDEEITDENVRNIPQESTLKEGFGVVEAARGLLLHWYKPTEDARVEAANFIPPTTCNNPAINISIRKAAGKILRGGAVDEASLNRIEVVMRAYDPCMACASHILGGGKVEVNLYSADGRLRRSVSI
ncbi:MAG: Ni/Fe hydrogenase subunit alpha [Candidatus Bathyarchaeia archaeon]